MTILWNWPVEAPRFIGREFWYESSEYAGGVHRALDMQRTGQVYADIYTIADGIVHSTYPNVSSLGNHVIMAHDGHYYSLYAHLNSVAVTAGQFVAAGHKIGVMGGTAGSHSYPVHLHLETYRYGLDRTPPGNRFDPRDILNTAREPSVARTDIDPPPLPSFNGDMENIGMYFRAPNGKVAVFGGSWADGRYVFTSEAQYARWRTILTVYNQQITTQGLDPIGKAFIPPANAADVVTLAQSDWNLVSTVYGVDPAV